LYAIVVLAGMNGWNDLIRSDLQRIKSRNQLHHHIRDQKRSLCLIDVISRFVGSFTSDRR
jgi:hypothetical protein